MKLDFVIPGFSKCATTTLCAMLAEHPRIFIPKIKETGFFAHKFNRGWDWYSRYFRTAGEDQLLGEGSTTYSAAEFADMACERMQGHFPSIRFIFMVRNPIKRIESSYRELHTHGHIFGVHAPFSIEETLGAFPAMIEDTRYWKLLSAYRARVPDDRILVLFLDDFQKQPVVELKRCFEFLGGEPSVPIANPDRKLNPASGKFYDTPLLRAIRTHRLAGRLWERCFGTEFAARCLRLKKRFQGPVSWREETRADLIEQLRDDVRKLLAHCGKPSDFWPEFGDARQRSAA